MNNDLLNNLDKAHTAEPWIERIRNHLRVDASDAVAWYHSVQRKRRVAENMAENFTTEELQEALRAITSTIGKCEKVLPKLKQGTSQHTLLIRRIKAFHIATSLIKKELPL